MNAKTYKILLISLLCIGMAFKNAAQSCVIITEPPVNNAGVASNLTLCKSINAPVIDLFQRVAGEDNGGKWSIAPASAVVSSGFDQNTGTFNPNQIQSGNYIFRYTVGIAGCEDSEDIAVLIETCCSPKICTPVRITKL